MELLDALYHLTDAIAPPRHGGPPRRSRGGADAPADNGDQSYGVAPVDIIETPKSYSFVLDVPGLSKSDIQVLLEEEKILVVKSNDKRKREEGDGDGEVKYLRMERSGSAKFQRRFRLPEDADAEAIKASCESGVLTVTVGKVAAKEEGKRKTVEVTVG